MTMNAKKYTWEDVVRFYFPNADKEDIHDLLWEATAYPFASVKFTCRQLHRKKRQVRDVPTNEKVNACVAIAHDEMAKSMEKARS